MFFPLFLIVFFNLNWSYTWTFLESSSSWFLWDFLFSQIKIEKHLRVRRIRYKLQIIFAILKENTYRNDFVKYYFLNIMRLYQILRTTKGTYKVISWVSSHRGNGLFAHWSWDPSSTSWPLSDSSLFCNFLLQFCKHFAVWLSCTYDQCLNRYNNR